MEVNFFGTVNLTLRFLQDLKKSKGRLVFVTSLTTFKACPGNGPYTASKWAVQGLAETLRIELKPFSVEVSTVQPGPMNTPMTQLDILSRSWRAALDGAPKGVQSQYGADFVDKILKNATRGHSMLDTADPAAKKICQALTDKAMQYHYRSGLVTQILHTLHRLFPDSVTDAIYYKGFIGTIPAAVRHARHQSRL